MERAMLILIIFTVASSFQFIPPSHASDNAVANLVKLENNLLIDISKKWKCVINKQQHCQASSCNPQTPSVWIELDLTNNTYSRCDTKTGCDTFVLKYSPSGIYSILTVANGHTFMKVLNDGSEFMEVASIMSSALIGFGKCLKR